MVFSKHLLEHSIDSDRHNLFILHNEMFIPISSLSADFTYFSELLCLHGFIYVRTPTHAGLLTK